MEFIGISNDDFWSELGWTVDSSWTVGSVEVAIQLYNNTLDSYPTSGDGFISYSSSVIANTEENKNQTIQVNPTDFRNATGYWKTKIKGVKETGFPFNFKLDWIEFKVKSIGSQFIIKNEGSYTLDLVSLWVNNSTHHQRYDMNLFINSGDTVTYIRNDIILPDSPFLAKVVTKRGNIEIFSNP